MSEIRNWLESIGLGQYGNAFEVNEIDMELLDQVDDQTLKDIGVSAAGHRLRIRKAIAKLVTAPVTEVNLSPTAPMGEIAAASAERRQLTVMFCDLVGSTAMSARLDPEDLREIISAYHRHCAQMIVKHGGFVARYMGDGVLAYFGYPQAHEDDAERAVRAGLALVAAAKELDVGCGTALQVRVGIATGLVVVGDLIADDPSHECEVVGQTPNLAARLQALAEPGAVVIDSNTRRLLGKLFEYRALGPLCVKGFDDLVAVWQVTGRSGVESRFAALRTSTTPLVGRDEEIDLLLRRWHQAKAGDGCVVLITGEPGIGKSRVAQTILERLSKERLTRLRYFCSFCSPQHQDSALYPVITQLEHAARFRRDDSIEQRLDKLEAALARDARDLNEAVPLYAALLSIPTGERYPPLNISPQEQKQRTLEVMLATVEGLAARQPLLIVSEDVQWIDPTSLELLDLIIDRVPALPVLLIVTFRPEFVPRWIDRLHVTLLRLSRLPPAQRAEMITSVAAGKTLPNEIAEEIIARTDGIPLFVEELTKAVLESGMLTDAGGRFTMTRPLPPLGIPASLIASLLARLDRSALMRQVAQIGAALGRQFSHELISAVATMPKQQLDEGLAQLVYAELIFRQGTPPDAEYTFKHALVQDTAYGTLLRSRRRQLHGRIAATLEERWPEIVQTQPEALARHCAEAGLVEKAVDYWLKAGQQAIGRSAMTEAVAQLQKGLDLLAAVPDGPWHQQQELDLKFTLGQALAATKGLSAPEVGETLVRARALAEQIDRPEYLVRLRLSQWMFHLVRSEHKRALLLAEEIERIGETRNDVLTQLQGRRAKGQTRYYLGELIAARALLERCYGLGDPARRAIGAGTADDYAATLAYLAASLAYLGYMDQARSRLNEALSEARRLRHAHTLAVVLVMANGIEVFTSSPELREHAEELLALSTEHEFSYFLGYATVFRGWSLTSLGRAREGLSELQQGLSMVRATGAILGTPRTLTYLAEAYAKLARTAEGLNCLAEAAQIVETTEERVGEAELHRLRADLLNAIGDRAAAEESLHLAIAVAERQSAKLFELRAAKSLARLWRDQGKRAEARDLLAPIYGWFTEGFDTPVLQDAKALLDELA